MNKYIKLFVLSLSMTSLTACNDTLDVDNDGHTTSSEIWKDRNKTRGYLNDCYQSRLGIVPNLDGITDGAVSVEKNIPGSNFARWYNDSFTVNDFYAHNMEGSPWAGLYQGIYKCNDFIENIDGATGDETEEEKQSWKAQAYTLRAMYYLELMKRYGQVPLVTTKLSGNYDYSQAKKATVGEITNQILADCDAALATPDGPEGFSWNIRDNQTCIMTRGVANYIKVEAMTYAKSPLFEDGTFTWDKAMEVVTEAFGELLSHDYSLWTSVTPNHLTAYDSYFAQNWNDKRAQDKETIYAVSGQVETSVTLLNGLPITDGQTAAGLCPSQELVDAFDMINGQEAITGYSDAQHLHPIINAASGYDDQHPYDNRDPRFYAMIWYNGSKKDNFNASSPTIETFDGGNCQLNETETGYKNTVTGYYLHKYLDGRSTKDVNYNGYWRSWRLADVYLYFAECAYQASSADNRYEVKGFVPVDGLKKTDDNPNGQEANKLSAKDALDVIRARAYSEIEKTMGTVIPYKPLPTGMDKQTFERRLRKERLIELYMEGKRFSDLRRWKALDTAKQVTGMRCEKQSDGTFKYTRFAFSPRTNTGDKYQLYPLESSEATKMEKLTGTSWQNPGW